VETEGQGHMRAQTNDESSQEVAADHAAQRTLQAAHLLQEALGLLRADPTLPTAHTTRRTPDRLLRLPEVDADDVNPMRGCRISTTDQDRRKSRATLGHEGLK